MNDDAVPDLAAYQSSAKPVQSDTDVNSQAIKVGDQWYIPLSLLLQKPSDVVQQCKHFNPKLNVFVPHVSQDDVQQSKDVMSVKGETS